MMIYPAKNGFHEPKMEATSNSRKPPENKRKNMKEAVCFWKPGAEPVSSVIPISSSFFSPKNAERLWSVVFLHFAQITKTKVLGEEVTCWIRALWMRFTGRF